MKAPTLLVVDDEPDIGAFVRDVARGVGYDAVATDDANEFPPLYSSETDVIVLDLAMPGIDGIELIRLLADNRSRASINLISGFDAGVLRSARELATGQGLRVIGTLTKPISIDDLESLLKDVSKPDSPYPETGTDEFPSLDELREAIIGKKLSVHYQPQVDMVSRTVTGVEALARWRHPVKGMIPPGMFIRFAEESGLIDDLTTVVMDEALRWTGEWNRAGRRLRTSINMSARTLTNLEFPEQLSAQVRKPGLDPGQVIIEVTESSVMEELSTSLDILIRLRMKGFGLSIDDFGTGYSSMQQLRNIPFTELKVDQSFVSRADTDDEARAIVETTVELGHRLGMTVVAEGVESESVWNLLASLDCEIVQGFLVARPMEDAALATWFENWKHKPLKTGS